MWDEQKKQHYPHHPHLKSQNARVWAPNSQPEPTLQKNLIAKLLGCAAFGFLPMFRDFGLRKIVGFAESKIPKQQKNAAAVLDYQRAVLEKLEYIHNNPVKRGLAAEPGEWLWPSWHAYNDNVSIPPVDLVFGEACGVPAGLAYSMTSAIKRSRRRDKPILDRYEST